MTPETIKTVLWIILAIVLLYMKMTGGKRDER